MRVTVLHNESAGSKNHAPDEIEAALEAAAYDVVAVVSDVDALLSKVHDKSCDLVVVAGGDGTVSRAACALAGLGIPLAILPLGTANNTALTLGVPLGVEGELDKVVLGWRQGSLFSVDLATYRRGSTLTRFSEAVGWGLFPALMAEADESTSPGGRERTLERDRLLLQRAVETAKPERYEITIDGETSSADYLLVEVMNIRHVGPQVLLSSASDPSDGHLELVVAQESDRPLLRELALHGSITTAAGLPVRRATQIAIQSSVRRLHLDGELIELSEPGESCSVTVVPAAVRYIVGAREA
jgi:diacylglycerol kinase family enzyme